MAFYRIWWDRFSPAIVALIRWPKVNKMTNKEKNVANEEKNLTKEEKNLANEERTKQKIEDLEKLLEEQENLAKERLDQIKYLQADFDNYRKNFEKDRIKIIELANESLIKDLLVILDDLEAAINSAESKDKNGIIMLQKKIYNILEARGLKIIETIKFDPNLHEVISIEKSDKEEGVILECLQKGFMLKSKVIRPSKIKISENEVIINGKRKNYRD